MPWALQNRAWSLRAFNTITVSRRRSWSKLQRMSCVLFVNISIFITFQKSFYTPTSTERGIIVFKLFHPCVSVCLSLCLSVHNKRVSMISRKLFITDAWNFKILFVQPSHTCIVRLIFIEIRRQFPVNDNSVYIKPNFWNKFSSKFFQQLLYTGFFVALCNFCSSTPANSFALSWICPDTVMLSER